jgi:GDPmannose 4,6-dehydratase
MRRAVVLGSAGQDGSLLFEKLVDDGWQVVGVDLTELRLGRLEQRPVERVTLGNPGEIDALVGAFTPDAIFHLAAYHQSSEEKAGSLGDALRMSYQVHVGSLVDVLEAVRVRAPRCHVFYAASSHVFGAPEGRVQTEETPFSPRSVYGVTKAAGVEVCRLYRRSGVLASAGILYNHESPRRAPHFVSQRIVRGAKRAKAAAAAGSRAPLVLGRLDAVVDWGWAPDYVDAMRSIVAHAEAHDYIVATGVPHTVRDFAAAAFDAVGLDWREHVEEDPNLLREELPVLVGDPTRLKTKLGWRPSVTFEQMVHLLLRD